MDRLNALSAMPARFTRSSNQQAITGEAMACNMSGMVASGLAAVSCAASTLDDETTGENVALIKGRAGLNHEPVHLTECRAGSENNS